ncbi:MAG: single-stranded-DNA-specific exonuclease RecJ [Proteobacteria bacterium]|nr:single-stranded-DNA-specific exonuclease RecJ [Pseudomonadota bacterium]MBK7114695.1 single-stranded-DNA-specific exonuclease RecJ [Pseudomonadota bacterium]
MSQPVRELRRRDAAAGEALPDSLPPLLRRIYAARHVTDEAQLATALSALLPVSALEGTREAARLLLQHAAGRVLVVGDFDADGATSTALMLRALREWGFAQVDFLVPDRFKFGYGLTPGIVELAAREPPTLLVTVDNGISSLEGVAAARALGIDVLITDHHLPGQSLPDATVIVNPNVPGSRFGSRALAGVGVAFYVLAALQRLMQEEGRWRAQNRPVSTWLDLVALGTVADLVPLDANNRVLVAQGMKRINAGHCVAGIRALLLVAQRAGNEVVAADLGFTVAPRLNAAGRLDDMSIGIRCLAGDEEAEVRALAVQLDQLNRQRREIEGQMQEQAMAAIRGLPPLSASSRHAGLCLFDAGWHQGVVGLVASRVKDRAARPVIAFAPAGDDQTLRGSARSIAGVHIRDVLENIASRHPGLIHRFGGHAMAAGLTIAAADLDRFARAFEQVVAEWLLDAEPDDAVWTDGPLEEAEICLATAEQLRAAGPWGQAFPEPVFDGEFEVESARVIGEKHVKFWLRPVGTRARFDAIAFNLLGERFPKPPQGTLRLAYRLDINQWQGERRLQLLVEHVGAP